LPPPIIFYYLAATKLVMSDSKQTDHWDLLASVLGTEPQKKEPVDPSPQEQKNMSEVKNDSSAQATSAASSNEKTDVRPSRTVSNWDAIAAELGIEVKAETAPPSAPPESPISESSQREVDIMPELPRERRKQTDLNFSKESDFLEPSRTSAHKEPEKPREKKTHRQRRRRRKSCDKDRAVAKKENKFLDSEREVSAGLDSSQAELPPHMSDLPGVEFGEQPQEGDSEQQRPKHRRSRRGSRKRKKKGSETVREKAAALSDGGTSQHAESAPDAEIEHLSRAEEENGEETEDHGQSGAKSGFRAIPTWGDAVGIIVAKNMESHPKRHGTGSPHTRGGASSRQKRRK